MIKIRNAKTRQYILHDDAAIDVDSPSYDWAKFVETGDMSALPIRDGAKPSIFTLKSLTRRQFMAVQDCADQSKKVALTLMHGLIGVKDVFNEHGDEIVLKTKKVDDVERLTDETLDALYAPELFAELAVVIWSMSQLGF